MRRVVCRRGIALVMLLIIIVVLTLLGISIAGLTTSQARYSLKRTGGIISRQAAVAGLNEAHYLLNANPDWTLADQFITAQERVLPENGCCYTLAVLQCSPENVKVTSSGYLRNLDGTRQWEKKITAIFARKKGGFPYAVQCLGSVTAFNDLSLKGTVAFDMANSAVTMNNIKPASGTSEYQVQRKPASTVTISYTNCTGYSELTAPIMKPPIPEPPSTAGMHTTPPILNYNNNPNVLLEPGIIGYLNCTGCTIHLKGGKYLVLDDCTIDNSTVIIDSATEPVEFFTAKNMLSNNSSFNASGRPGDLLLCGGPACEYVRLSGTIPGSMIVCNPAGLLEINNSTITGSAVGKVLQLNNSTFIQGDDLEPGPAGSTHTVTWDEE